MKPFFNDDSCIMPDEQERKKEIPLLENNEVAPMYFNDLYKQFRQNLVPFFSVLIAALALVYNAWRNERTEGNRTVRVAAFEVLKDLGELQVVINNSFYGEEGKKGDPMLGWGYIALIGDLSSILPPPIPEKSDALIKAWQMNWSKLTTSEESADKISGEIDNLRLAIREELKQLR